MSIEDYISLLFDTFKDNERFFEQGVVRAMHKAKQDYLVGNHEFLSRSVDLVDDCIKKANDFNTRLLDELKMSIENYKGTDEQDYYVKRLSTCEKEEPYYNYRSINKNYFGLESDNIIVSDLLKIKKILNKIGNKESVRKRINNSENEPTKNKEKVVENKFPNIFRNIEGSLLWLSLFENFRIKENSRSDVKFIFEEMKKDLFLHDFISQKNFLDWINDEYNLAIAKTSNHHRSKVRLSIYAMAKEKAKSSKQTIP
ncbi:hypothetical protein [Algibacter mikhailovii]|uniref:hypothetical protein n=1 Tax=Algibacter mikhailovii TaxID=425498 RepID=UPI0024946AD2|nr:hypothetical protein [Algibacter mikhailovii]